MEHEVFQHHDVYYRVKDLVIRMPIQEDDRPRCEGLDDPILEHVIFDGPPMGIFAPSDLTDWSIELFHGRIPMGYNSMDEFRAYLKESLGVSYENIKNYLKKRRKNKEND